MAIPRNKTEILALEKFAEVVKDLEFGNGILMRFLRARNLNLKKAEEMIRQFVVWREKRHLNKLDGWLPPKELYAYKMYLAGFDNEGRPVIWAPFGEWPGARDLLEKGMESDILNFTQLAIDRLYQVVMQTNHQQIVLIIDLQGLTFAKVFHEAKNWKGNEILMNLMKDYENNFPEMLFKAFMINTPLAFMWAWKFLRPFLADCTVEKVHFFGTSQTEITKWKSEIFHQLPADTIPEIYGGTATLIEFDNLESEVT